MTDVETPPPAPTPEEPETLRGVVLAPAATLRPRPPHVDLPELPVNGRLSSWHLLEHAATLARMIAPTDFVPKRLQGRAAAVAACILYGHEIGLGPMTALQRIYVTDRGEIIVSAQAMRAIVRSHGHRLWPDDDPEERSSARYTWHGQRRDDEHIYTVTWTRSDAVTAGLIRTGSAWEKAPRQMLSARASAELCRLMAEDALAGIAYTLEEMQDGFRGLRDVTPPEEAAPESPAPAQEPPSPPQQRSVQRNTRPRRQKATEAATAPQGGDAPAAALPGTVDAAPAVAPSEPSAAGAAPAVPDDTWSQLEVPGDNADAAPATGAEPDAAPSPDTDLPGTAEEAKLPVPPSPPPSHAQAVAIAARNAGVDRADLCAAVTAGAKRSARELEPHEATAAIQHARAIRRGEEQIVYDPHGLPSFYVIPDEEIRGRAERTLHDLYEENRERAVAILHGLGWTSDKGLAPAWLKEQSRETLLTLIDRCLGAAPQEKLP